MAQMGVYHRSHVAFFLCRRSMCYEYLPIESDEILTSRSTSLPADNWYWARLNVIGGILLHAKWQD